MSTANLSKIIHPGDVPQYDGRKHPMFCKVLIKKGKLSISGVIGPKKNGDAYGNCGQIDMDFDHLDKSQNDRRTPSPITADEINFSNGWSKEKWYTFLDIWAKWHLNDMRAGCVHQTAMKWGSKKITVLKMKLKTEVWKKQDAIKKAAIKALEKTGTANITEGERKLINLEWSFTSDRNPIPEYYDIERTEETTDGWKTEAEHPEGKMSKPCPVCGYKYGTAWLSEDLPIEVINFLNELPDTDIIPAWV